MHQSPIDFNTTYIDEKHVIGNNDNDVLIQNYGSVSYSDAISHNNGTSVQFDLKDNNQVFSSSVTKKWFPNE